MKRICTFFVALLGLFAFSASAQIVTTSPAILQEESQNVVLTFNAASPLGNDGMKGLPASTAVYAHAGVITNKSNGGWAYAPDWLDNSAKYKLTNAGTDLWKLNIGDIRTYFGITDPDEHVLQLALVFRDATGSHEGKTKDVGDIFVDVHESGFIVALTTDAPSTVLTSAATINFTVNATRSSNINLSVNGTSVKTASNATSLTASYNFSKNGSYTVKAEATAGGETVSDEMVISYPTASAPGEFPLGDPSKHMGATYNADGSVTFCFAAPNKRSVVLVPEWDDYDVLDKNTMKYHDYNGNRFFWITVPGISKNEYHCYYYLVDGVYRVADPYSRLILDPYSDKWLAAGLAEGLPKYPYTNSKVGNAIISVLCGDLHNYQFAPFTIPDHFNLTIYELLLRDFTGTEGASNGDGTLRLAMEKIPYLKRLGVNAVELMPIMEFNGNNSWGYNTNCYFAPDKAYGTPLEYKQFIDECHKNGMAVILDIVFNQSDGLHAWYQMYSPEENPFYNATAPHDYSVLNDWKQENVLVRQQWEDCIRYWMTEYNVDGFRFDLVKGLGDSNSYAAGTEAYNASRVANMKRLNDVIKSVKANGIHINENLAKDTEENEMAASGQLNWVKQSQIGYNFAKGAAADVKYFYDVNCSRTAGSGVVYVESHDEQRAAYEQLSATNSNIKNKFSVKMNRLGGMAVSLLMNPGPKMIWQFGELGNDENTKNGGNNNVDPKKVRWSDLNDPDRAALFETYAALCELRSKHTDLFSKTATFKPQLPGTPNQSTRYYTIYSGDKEVVAVINPHLGATTANVKVVNNTMISASNYKVICASKGYDNPTVTGTAGNLTVNGVPSHGYVVLATSNVSGIDDVLGDLGAAPSVIGGTGEIIISGDYQKVSVYDLQGRSYGRTTSLQPGLYIVNVDGHASKVMVK